MGLKNRKKNKDAEEGDGEAEKQRAQEAQDKST